MISDTASISHDLVIGPTVHHVDSRQTCSGCRTRVFTYADEIDPDWVVLDDLCSRCAWIARGEPVLPGLRWMHLRDSRGVAACQSAAPPPGGAARMTVMGAFSHVIEYDGGVMVLQIGPRSDPTVFAGPLHHFNGQDQWALTLSPLPEGQDYDNRSDADDTQFLQAAGSDPDTITVEIRKPGGQNWGVDFVRYAVGHPTPGVEALDVPVTLPGSTQYVSRSEVFTADEAADLFWEYYQNGDIPSGYSLRPIDGYTAQGAIYDLRDGAPRKVR